MDWQALGHLATTFESTHIAPADAADAFYIVVSGGDLLIKDDDGDITPISADDWRWCGLEAISQHCLGVVAVWVRLENRGIYHDKLTNKFHASPSVVVGEFSDCYFR